MSITPLMPVYPRCDVRPVRGEGCYLYGEDGTQYLDFAAGIAVNALGHGHPHLTKAIQEQAAIYEQELMATSDYLADLDATAIMTTTSQQSRTLFIGGASGMSKAAARLMLEAGGGVVLLGRQRAFRQAPGLVGDGRDMGSVVFPDAALKVFLTASVEIRAERRYKQLIEKGVSANLESLSQDLRERDERDRNRAHAPLVQLPDALLLDTSSMSADAAVRFVLDAWRERNPQ